MFKGKQDALAAYDKPADDIGGGTGGKGKGGGKGGGGGWGLPDFSSWGDGFSKSFRSVLQTVAAIFLFLAFLVIAPLSMPLLGALMGLVRLDSNADAHALGAYRLCAPPLADIDVPSRNCPGHEHLGWVLPPSLQLMIISFE